MGWKTPNQVIYDAYVRTFAYIFYLARDYHPNEKPLRQLLPTGDLVININEPKLQNKKQKKVKRKHFVRRYLQYLDWDEKRRIKSLTFLLAMSQSYSHEVIHTRL